MTRIELALTAPLMTLPVPFASPAASASSISWPRPLRVNISGQEQTLHRYISVKTAAKKDATAAAPPTGVAPIDGGRRRCHCR